MKNCVFQRQETRRQESIPVGCVPLACQRYLFWLGGGGKHLKGVGILPLLDTYPLGYLCLLGTYPLDTYTVLDTNPPNTSSHPWIPTPTPGYLPPPPVYLPPWIPIHTPPPEGTWEQRCEQND